MWELAVETGFILALCVFFSFTLVCLLTRLFAPADVQNQLCDSVLFVATLSLFILLLWIEWDKYVKRRAEAAEAVTESARRATKFNLLQEQREKRAREAEDRVFRTTFGCLIDFMKHPGQGWNSDAVASRIALLYLRRFIGVIVATSAIVIVLPVPISYTLLSLSTALNGTTFLHPHNVSPTIFAPERLDVISTLQVEYLLINSRNACALAVVMTYTIMFLQAQWARWTREASSRLNDPELTKHGMVVETKIKDEIVIQVMCLSRKYVAECEFVVRYFEVCEC